MSQFTLSPVQRSQIESFHNFCMQRAGSHCAYCVKLLYPQDEYHMNEEMVEAYMSAQLERPTQFPCQAWNLEPIEDDFGVVVCKSCRNRPQPLNEQLIYPGDIPEEVSRLNYREKSYLSPIKLMTQLVRKSGLNPGKLGHYELAGSAWMTHNLDFIEMAYSGSISLPFRAGTPENVDMERVREAYAILKERNPLLADYDQPSPALVDYYISYVNSHNEDAGFLDNVLMPVEATDPNAPHAPLHQQVMGTDTRGNDILASHPSLMALIFVYLFIEGKGHYSLVDRNAGDGIPEEDGGVAKASASYTLKAFAKALLIIADRRFARDAPFIFWLLDMIEKHDINSSDRHTVNSNLGRYKKSDVVDANGKFVRSKITTVPDHIRSSLAYKKKTFLDLKAICDNLGAPQLFLTFSCDDFAEHMRNATGDQDPWVDPFLFGWHYKRCFQEFFQTYIKKKWGQVGEITDFCWVMEVQQRGSPHYHMVLWTSKTPQELLESGVVCCTMPPPENEELTRLVNRHQKHVCNAAYCLKEDGTCRFNYPRSVVPEDYIDVVNEKVFHKRGPDDGEVNNYNPYLLSLFRTNMDIQINLGRSAMYYLSKYLTKSDNVVEFSVGRQNDTNITSKEHMKARIVGSIEAMYDLNSWHKHQSSRDVQYLNCNLQYNEVRQLRRDIKDLPDNEEDIYNPTDVQKYEQRGGAPGLTLGQFYCFYNSCTREVWSRCNSTNSTTFPGYTLPTGVKINTRRPTYYKLRTKNQRFWRTHEVSSTTDAEAFYYMQIVTRLPIFNTTFEEQMAPFMTWKLFFTHLVQTGQITFDGPINETQATADEPTSNDAPMNRVQQQHFNTITGRKAEMVHFVMGSAGTGKSFLLDKLYRHFSEDHMVIKLAPTGVAAYNIHGITLHRFFSMPNNQDVIDKVSLTRFIKSNPKLVFLIDEFSMISKQLLETIHNALVEITSVRRPFGGIRCVFFGDLAQLLPINKNNNIDYIWKCAFFREFKKLPLLQSMRQAGDEDFKSILAEVRHGHFDLPFKNFVRSREITYGAIPKDAIKLYPANADVRAENEKGLNNLPGELMQYRANDYPVNNRAASNTLTHETKLAPILSLKVDAIVMLIQNLDVVHGWVNGAMAIIEEMDTNDIKLRHLDTGQTRWIHRVYNHVHKSTYTREQFPIVLAFACTIHKVQSLTMPKVAIYTTDFPSHGQLYVAMSRVKRAQDLFFFGRAGDLFNIEVDSDAIEIVATIEDL